MSATFRVITSDQRSPAWVAARIGCLTASRAADILATIKSGEAAPRRDYRTQLVCERLTGAAQENGFLSADMQRGLDLEDEAVAAYEMVTGRLVSRVGFLRHANLAAGASPDGVVGEYEGLIEVKAPKSATHLTYWRSGGVPAAYRPQLTHQLWITGAAWVDFVSYDPRFPAALQVFLVRLVRDADAIAAYEHHARAFLAEVDRETEAVRSLAGAAAMVPA